MENKGSEWGIRTADGVKLRGFKTLEPKRACLKGPEGKKIEKVVTLPHLSIHSYISSALTAGRSFVTLDNDKMLKSAHAAGPKRPAPMPPRVRFVSRDTSPFSVGLLSNRLLSGEITKSA